MGRQRFILYLKGGKLIELGNQGEGMENHLSLKGGKFVKLGNQGEGMENNLNLNLIG